MWLDPLYTAILRPLLFRLDPERAHQLAIALVQQIGKNPPLQKLAQQLFGYAHPALSQTIWGLHFPNPIGLAAGFDKNGSGIGAWADLGFGFAEIGTVTAHPQAGNPRPRLFRIPQDQAILNRMGFNNDGAVQIAQKLQTYRQQCKLTVPLGINLGKSKVTPLEQAPTDYLQSFQLCYEWGDYFVVNVSSPNTEGLRNLQNTAPLTEILTTLQAVNTKNKPLLIKIAPDLTWAEIDAILEVCYAQNISGIIATNTTVDKTNLSDRHFTAQAGGISGLPLQKKSTEIIRYIYQHTEGKLPIIGVGGINSSESAWEKLTAGASLLQVYTGLVYQGFALNRQILQGIIEKMNKIGIYHLQEIVGSYQRVENGNGNQTKLT
ncbi:MAG: quinone-dependent dihydroorotate dehydrogenase [Pseudanabaenaceae cyanobacterium]